MAFKLINKGLLVVDVFSVEEAREGEEEAVEMLCVHNIAEDWREWEMTRVDLSAFEKNFEAVPTRGYQIGALVLHGYVGWFISNYICLLMVSKLLDL